MSATRRKCANRRGETLLETLVSLLVSTLALTMLAGMIFKSASLLNKSMDNMQEHTERMNLLNNPLMTDLTPQQLADMEMEVGAADVTISVLSGDTIKVRYVLDKTDNTISYVKSGR